MCLGHLIKLAGLSACFAFWALSAQAQNFSALARIDSATSAITNAGNDNVLVALQLSQGVPFRVFTLSRPDRLVIDFREVDWTGLDSKTLLQSHKIVGVRFGGYRPGWSRLVAQMGQPMAVADVAMTIAPETEAANLSLLLRPASRAVYDAAAGALFDPRWDLPPDTLDPPRRDKASRRLVVMLDPGHGGIDPGAENRGIKEADLMLLLARELKDTLLRTGDYDVLLTREADVFVSLEDRVRLAHQRGADVFISLHADALAHGVAHGARIFTLSDAASDAASAALAERHDRLDILSGIDLNGADDVVTDVLLDLARLETAPRARALAQSVLAGIENATGDLYKLPLQQAAFSVLKAADIPSILVEAGFLSTDQDLDNLIDPLWRAGFIAGLRDGLAAWVISDRAEATLRRR
ncbi:MAG TPA: N-acetylmuramoyl-L-alanine amidase [Rhodobacteraceae bacterium]|jgi:N-acetylmuramoyl-L-alanine amidase|nr:N-acetylmuramoyl-L-alanine amidase [Paracoccaceae bacterium]